MRTTRLLSTTAAVLLIGGGIAFAQGMKTDEQPARAPAAQQNAPAEKLAPPMRTHKAPETTGQGAMSSDTEHSEHSVVPNGANKPANAEEHGHNSLNMRQGANADETKSSTGKDQSRRTTGQASEKTETRSTTGQGAASAAKLSTEQRTRITTIIHRHKVAPVHLNVSVTVGTRVPAHVHLYPLPIEVVDVYPEWRGYDYILVGDEIVVIDPATHDIVAVIDA